MRTLNAVRTTPGAETMDAQSYAGVSEEEFATFVQAYRALCSSTPWIYLFLFADMCAKGFLWASWLVKPLEPFFAPLGLVVTGLPLLVYFVITFCRLPPPISPRTFQRLLLFIIAATTGGTIVLAAVVLIAWGRGGSLGTSVTVPLIVTVAASLCVVAVLRKHHNRFELRQPLG